MGSQTDKLELDPEVMYANVEEKRYKAELELLDRYLKFNEIILFSKQFGSRAFQPGLYVPQAGIGLGRRGEAQATGRAGLISKAYR